VTDRSLVTVGIPFNDEERHLAGAIRSVLRQTYPNLELLLIDDGSRDASLAIARSFRDERIRVVSDGRRRFLPARLNEIVALARGDLVARMDADDVSHPDRLRRQIDALDEAGAGHDAVGSWAGLVDEEERVFAIVEAARDPSPAVALERGLIPHATLIARRPWLLANAYDEALTRAEDRDFWCRAVRTTKVAVVPEPLYAVRVAPRHPTFLPDYLESQRQNRILYQRYGRSSLGWARASRAWASSLAKSAVMQAATRIGLADRVVHRRGRPPTESERRMVEEALSAQRA
jgi:glycosyltransferase involved in cell wall biosynthesis